MAKRIRTDVAGDNPVLPAKDDACGLKAAAGLYIHIPFCLRKCPYCDFYSITRLGLKNRFLSALETEMALRAPKDTPVDTVYIGGGTPSLLSVGELTTLFKAARQHFEIDEEAEITVEVNPGTAKRSFFDACMANGVNRINIGIQSLKAATLTFLERMHTPEEAFDAVRLAKTTGLHRIGFDLIYGIPGQTDRAWQKELQTAVRLQPSHLSCYSLTYEAGTPLTERLKQGRIEPLPDGAVAELMDITHDLLTGNDYHHYEISNFARRAAQHPKASHIPDNRSRHNLKYWSRAPYIGLGPAAHSFVEPVRAWNVSNVAAYIARLETGQSALAGQEHLKRGQLMLEVIYLSLRKMQGIDIKAFERRFAVSFETVVGSALGELCAEGLLAYENHRCRLTRRGVRFMDTVVTRLVAAL